MQISVSSWSFHTPLYAGAMRLWEVPRAVRALGFAAVELQDMFLWPYGNRLLWSLRRLTAPANPAPAGRFYDAGLLRRVREALRQEQMTLSAWNCDPELGRPDYLPDVRAYIRAALRTAADLGAPVLRITMDHQAAGTNIRPIIDVLGSLLADAERAGVRMALENHGHTAEAGQILAIIQGVNSPWLGVCLDFGNFAPGCAEVDFERLAPHAIHVHAKSYAFDPAGEEVNISYRHRIEALHAAGYGGVIAIEYEGESDPAVGISATRTLLERHW